VAITQLRVEAHDLQPKLAHGLDLFLGFDFEMAERKGMLKPFQVEVNIKTNLELVY
jgi:hypothetical protein